MPTKAEISNHISQARAALDKNDFPLFLKLSKEFMKKIKEYNPESESDVAKRIANMCKYEEPPIGVAEYMKNHGRAVVIRLSLNMLTCEERIDIISRYCVECGNEKPCYCMNK